MLKHKFAKGGVTVECKIEKTQIHCSSQETTAHPNNVFILNKVIYEEEFTELMLDRHHGSSRSGAFISSCPHKVATKPYAPQLQLCSSAVVVRRLMRAYSTGARPHSLRGVLLSGGTQGKPSLLLLVSRRSVPGCSVTSKARGPSQQPRRDSAPTFNQAFF